jgi:hypothetical protein
MAGGDGGGRCSRWGQLRYGLSWLTRQRCTTPPPSRSDGVPVVTQDSDYVELDELPVIKV